ncbi:MAG: ISNCY family transposase, partial [Chlorobium sp.]|nr:ISNCY family transposase [Chlorobium sp.]
KQYRKVQRLKHSTSKDESKQQQKVQEIQEVHRAYLDLAKNYLALAEQTRQKFRPQDPVFAVRLCELNDFIQHAHRQIDQID